MPSTTTFKRGQVLVVNVPFSGRSGVKPRPALIIKRRRIPSRPPRCDRLSDQQPVAHHALGRALSVSCFCTYVPHHSRLVVASLPSRVSRAFSPLGSVAPRPIRHLRPLG